jgi:hypothetical protein
MLVKFKPFLKLPFKHKLLAFEVLFFLTLAKACILLLPFSMISKYLLIQEKRSFLKKGNKNQYLFLQRITLYIYELSKYLPWKAVCFDQALTARWIVLLRGISSKFHFGVMTDQNQKNNLKAHAWLMVDHYCIIGHGYEDYHIINTY